MGFKDEPEGGIITINLYKCDSYSRAVRSEAVPLELLCLPQQIMVHATEL